MFKQLFLKATFNEWKIIILEPSLAVPAVILEPSLAHFLS